MRESLLGSGCRMYLTAAQASITTMLEVMQERLRPASPEPNG